MDRAHAGSVRSGILQVHPTRRCNLACAHCYSASSPHENRQLAPEIIATAIADAAVLGFGVVSLSGGEPLLYDGLDVVVAATKTARSRLNIVSNGILIRSPRYARHSGAFSVVALSLDGTSTRHNALRGSPRSFDQVRAAATDLRSRGQRFGIVHTLCSESLAEVEEIAAIASDWGAELLQLHPFEPVGRGYDAVGLGQLNRDERLDAFLLAAMLAEEYPQLKVQLDLVHREVASRFPEALGAAAEQMSQPPGILVLEDDGCIVPLTYGIDRTWAVVDLHRGRLAETWPSFVADRWPRLQWLLRLAAQAAARGDHGEVVDWQGLVRRYATADTTRTSAHMGCDDAISHRAT